MIQDIFLKLSWPNWIFALLLLVLALLAWFFYFRTLPPLSLRRRLPGFLLRSLSLAMVLFLILEPVLQFIYRNTEKPVVAVLFDNSASMTIRDANGPRADSLRYVLQQLDQIFPQDSVELRRYAFDAQLNRLHNDSLSLNVDGSNLDRALNTVMDSLAAENLQGVVLVSDGVYNQGVNPLQTAQKLTVPLYSVLIGDPDLPRDLVVRRVQSNSVAYVGKQLPVEVVLSQNGYDGQTVLLSLSRGGKQLARKQVTLGKSGFEQKEMLDFVADEAGDFSYTISVQELENEVTVKNNLRITRIRVLKSKINVLVMSGSADFDRHFLKIAAGQLDDFVFAFRTEAARGSYFEGSFTTAALDTQDLLILHGFPTAGSDENHIRQLLQFAGKNRKPVFWLPNAGFAASRLQAFREQLPFELPNTIRGFDNLFARLTATGKLHPATRLDESDVVTEMLWSELPPVEYFSGINPPKDAQILLEVYEEGALRGGTAPAMCYAFRRNEQKQLVFSAANFGNWHFQLQENPAREAFFVSWLERSMRWLVNRDDINKIQIQPLQQVYNVGEAVQFGGQVYDEFYNQIADARVSISVYNDSLRQSDDMTAEGNGFYRQAFSGLPQGDYSYDIVAERNGRRIGQRSGKFAIKPFFLEYQQISANHDLMRQLAMQSGGRAYKPSEFVRHFADNSFTARRQFSFTELFLWNYWYWLVALITFLGLEWFLRKRWGLL